MNSASPITSTTPIHCNVVGYETKGQHASDLVDFQKVFQHSGDIHRSVVAITLESTKDYIGKLIERGISREDIISLSSLMRQSPGGVIPMHFLFGPGSTQNRKVAIGMNRGITPFAQEILNRCEAQAIKIIETDIPRHDRCSGFIQGLTNCVQLLVGDTENSILHDDCMKKWKTSASTVFGLMYNNADAELAIKQFFDSLEGNGNNPLHTFLQVIETNISTKDMDDFQTPNFERMFHFAHSDEGSFSLPIQRIETVRGHLNSDGEIWLPEEIKRIRKNIQEL